MPSLPISASLKPCSEGISFHTNNLRIMKRIRCPKCGSPIAFDETRYEPGTSLVFECTECRKQFRLRLPSRAQEAEEEQEAPVLARLTVVENGFQQRQVINLVEGENVIGRHVRGTGINAPITTVDPSIDTTHCIINISRRRDGSLRYLLRDAPSGTGTFLGAGILGDRDRVPLEDGDVITIGAATMIFRSVLTEEDEE